MGSESSSSVHVRLRLASSASSLEARSSVPRARRSTRVRRTARRVRAIAFVVMDAILAQMRAAQGIVEDVSDDAQTAAGDEFGASTTTASTTPSAEAAYHRAMVSLCAEFASATKERSVGGGTRTLSLGCTVAASVREPFPRGEILDAIRSSSELRAAGSTSGEAIP